MAKGQTTYQGNTQRINLNFFDSINSLAGYNIGKRSDIFHGENLRSRQPGIVDKREGMAAIGNDLGATHVWDSFYFETTDPDNSGLYQIATVTSQTHLYYLKKSTQVWTRVTTLALGILELGNGATTYTIARSGTTVRYTWDGLSPDPGLTQKIHVGTVLDIQANQFNAANKGTFTVTAVTPTYFEVTNASGVNESSKAISSGFIRASSAVFSHAVAEKSLFLVNGETTNLCIAPDGVTITTEATALSHLKNSPRARKVTPYKNRLYLGDITINGVRYREMVQFSSEPSGIVGLVDIDYATGARQIEVSDTKYVDVGGTINVYRDALHVTDFTVVSKTATKLLISPKTAVPMEAADELWYNSTYSGTRYFLWATNTSSDVTDLTFGVSTTDVGVVSSGSDWRYYWNAGPNPLFNNLAVGDVVIINVPNFNVLNNGTFTVTAVDLISFYVTNAAGVFQSPATIGGGTISLQGFSVWNNSLNGKLYDTFSLTGGGGNGRLKLLETIGDVLVMANDDNMSTWDNYTQRILDLGIGCVADRGHIRAFGSLWFIHNSGMYSFTGDGAPELVSSPVDRYFLGATPAGLQASAMGKKGFSVFATIGDVSLYHEDGSLDDVVSDGVIEYDLRKKGSYFHTDLPFNVMLTQETDTTLDRLVAFRTDTFRAYEFLTGSKDLISTAFPNVVNFRMDTQRIYLSPRYNQIGVPLQIGVEVERGGALEVFASIEGKPFYKLDGVVRKGLLMLNFNGIDDDHMTPARGRYVIISLRDTTPQTVRVSRMFIDYIEAVEDEQLVDYDVNSS